MRSASRVSYREYITSPKWRERSWVTKDARGRKCKRCGVKQKRLHVHHLTYEHLGDEYKEELVVLCDYCHALEHLGEEDYVPEKTTPNRKQPKRRKRKRRRK